MTRVREGLPPVVSVLPALPPGTACGAPHDGIEHFPDDADQRQ